MEKNEDWYPILLLCSIFANDKQIQEACSGAIIEIDRLQEELNKYPKTADGVTVEVGTTVYYWQTPKPCGCSEIGCFRVDGIEKNLLRSYAANSIGILYLETYEYMKKAGRYKPFYFTREAAEKSKGTE